MPSFIDRTGEIFGQLTALHRGETKSGKTMWVCRCSCGSICEYRASNLVTGNSTKCVACREISLQKHGKAKRSIKSQEYNSWNSMKDRCYNKNNESYINYGARGITVCQRWLNSFENFLEDMGEKPSPSHSIERVDNTKSYSKGNCVWADKVQQAYNKRKCSRNTSGVEGVYFRKDTGKWSSYINKEGTRYNLGSFDTISEAIDARRKAEIKFYGKIKEN